MTDHVGRTVASESERVCECQNENRGLFVWRGDPDWLSCTQCDGRVRPMTDQEREARRVR